MTIDPEMLMAYADGELDDLAAKRVERAIEADPALAEQVRQHRLLTARVAASYARVAAAPVPGHLADMLRSNVVPLPTRERRRHWATGLAMAASLAIGLVVGRGLLPASDSGFDPRISGELAQALDTQLASVQPAGAAARVGLSFRARDGRYCRSYEQAEAAGIACREDDGWTQRHWIAVPRQDTQYRQAGANGIAAAAQAMMAGEPLDAAGERAAREAGWRAE
ncbi:anti-sigma factor [Sphingomonas gilva]|uniref:Anti-sigma factor n=1 Tax=Sphingomonas gilva TaxID=2305907 RepID=A0A396RR03_9SPHN|nr:anti-sigma factor [Sphingomonas gilva]RHW19077.1 anti-sigma factor [Sphingomonas gilva]